jgi:hypothetical protein
MRSLSRDRMQSASQINHNFNRRWPYYRGRCRSNQIKYSYGQFVWNEAPLYPIRGWPHWRCCLSFWRRGVMMSKPTKPLEDKLTERITSYFIQTNCPSSLYPTDVASGPGSRATTSGGSSAPGLSSERRPTETDRRYGGSGGRSRSPGDPCRADSTSLSCHILAKMARSRRP